MTVAHYGDPASRYGTARYSSAALPPSPTGKKRPMAKVALKISTLTDTDALAKGQTATAGCAGTALATPTPPEATALATATTDFDTALADQSAKTQAAQAATEVKNQKRAVMETAYTACGGKAQTVSTGDAAFILARGYAVAATPAPIGELPAPANLVATMGDLTGEVDVAADRVRGAVSYIIQYTTTPNVPGSYQQAGVSAKSSFTVPGLVSGTPYWFRMAAIGSAGQGPWSDPAEKMAP